MGRRYSLLKDFEDAPDKPEPLATGGKKRAAPGRLMPVPVGKMDVGHTTMNAGFSKDQAEAFIKYYGVHPDLMEGARYFGNSEK